jgi:hypothetical protein
MAAPPRWQQETEKYSGRIAALKLMTRELENRLSQFPGSLHFRPTDAGVVRHLSLIFVNHNLASAAELIESVRLLWRNARFLAAAHCVRLLLELWGSLIYAQDKVVNKLAAADGAKVADQRLNKLLLGTKSGPALPAGIPGIIPVINVMEFVRAGETKSPGFEGRYNFLCDVSHPSYMHEFIRFSTFDGAWANPGFASEAHRILEQITASAEMATTGIAAQSYDIYQECLPALVAEIKGSAS